MIGLSPATEYPRSEEWVNLTDEEDRSRLQQAIEAHLTGERSHFEIEYRVRHVDGNVRWVHCRGIAVRDEVGPRRSASPGRRPTSPSSVAFATRWHRPRSTTR